ncbi:MAG: hypothetical protein GX541_00700 [Clostridiales bacterium]|jgi:hypothetical protein|nr:hypothetical protein [Clostridiales bacterium]
MPAAQKRRKRKTGILGRFIIYIIILLFVSLTIFFLNRTGANSVLRLIYMLGSGITGDMTEEASISFDMHEMNEFHAFKRGLAVISPNQLSVYKMSGERTLFEPLLFHSPAVSGCNDSFAVYDRSGTGFLVTNGKKILMREEAPAKISKITMNKNGAFTLITDGPDCKSMVTVYNSSMNTVYKLYSSEQFVFDAILSNDAKSMAVLGYSAKSGGFEGNVTVYGLNSESPLATFTLPDDMPIAAGFQSSDTLFVLTEDSLKSVKLGGEIQTLLEFKSTELNGFFVKDRFFSMLLNGNLSGGRAEAVTVKRNSEPVRIGIDGQILGFSVSDRHIAVGFSDRIDIYSDGLAFKHSFPIAKDIKSFIIRDDGTLLTIGENFAKLLIP